MQDRSRSVINPRFLHLKDSSIHLLVLLLGVSFGNLADKYGRRPMYALAMFGTLCFLAWTYLVCA